MATIKDSSTGTTAKVFNDKSLSTRAVTITESSHATNKGDGYNINSGLITLTNAAESGILYFKNNEDRDIHISSIIVIMGPSTGGLTTDTTHFRVYANSTTGTLISTATAADISANRNFGLTSTLSADAYKGTTGATITDGDVVIESLISPGSRVPFPIDIDLPKGKSISVSLEPNDSNTSMKVMMALVLNLEVSSE